MTLMQSYTCNCCEEIQTIPETWETNYLILLGGGIGAPRHLCPECKNKVLDIIAQLRDDKLHTKANPNKSI